MQPQIGKILIWHILAEITVGGPSDPRWQNAERHLTTVAGAVVQPKGSQNYSKLQRGGSERFVLSSIDCGQDAYEGCDTTCKPGVSTDTSAPIPARAAGPRVGPPQGLLSLPPSGFSKGHSDLHPARLKRDHVGVRRSGGNSH